MTAPGQSVQGVLGAPPRVRDDTSRRSRRRGAAERPGGQHFMTATSQCLSHGVPGPAKPRRRGIMALRPVIALHGKDGNASQMLEIGVEDGLTQLVKAGKPPFAVVGVDGGNTYWHRRASGGDSGAMVLEELLPMLAAMGMDTSRVGF